MELLYSLIDDQYPDNGYNHTRPIVRAILYNNQRQIALIHVLCDDIFGHRDYLETPGGGVEDGEELISALKRELREELNVEVEIIKELGVYDKLYKTWRLDGESFDIQYEIHVFDTKLKKKLDGNFGLEGEFNNSAKIVEIDKETLISSVKVFRDYGIKID